MYGPVMCGLQLHTHCYISSMPSLTSPGNGSADTGRDLSGDTELEGRDSHLGERSDPSIARGQRSRYQSTGDVERGGDWSDHEKEHIVLFCFVLCGLKLSVCLWWLQVPLQDLSGA